MLLLGAGILPGHALAEDGGALAGLAASAPDTLASSQEPEPYVFPSGKRQFVAWAWNALGPAAIGGNAVGASWRQWVTEEPVEWGDGAEAFGKRFGAGCMTTAIGETSLSLASAALREDPAYYRSPRSGLWPRLRHALVMTFMSRKPDGTAVFSAPKTLSPFVGPVVAWSTVYPESEDLQGGLVSGAYGLLITAGWNAMREFVVGAPEWGAERPSPPRHRRDRARATPLGPEESPSAKAGGEAR